VGTATQADADRWHERAVATLAEALALTPGAEGERLRARAGLARAALAPLATAAPTPLTLVHGDLHVGQVLRHDRGYAVTDFDGNPVLPSTERSRPQPPARDVAGMLRSLDHVGRIANRRTAGQHVDRVDAWIAATRAAFLAAYDGPLLDERLLRPFEVEQECRELVYAARHLPRWRYVPDAALAALLPLPAED
jgi:maltokinase